MGFILSCACLEVLCFWLLGICSRFSLGRVSWVYFTKNSFVESVFCRESNWPAKHKKAKVSSIEPLKLTGGNLKPT